MHAVSNESIRYQLPSYCHNLVEMQLIRLPMTKDGSNIEGCSASSSEDGCKTIVFAWVLDLVPYGCVFWGVVKPLVGFFTRSVGRMVLGLDWMAYHSPVSFEGRITATGSPYA